MKDENGISISCENCVFYKYCEAKCTKTDCLVGEYFTPTEESLKNRIQELQAESDKYKREAIQLKKKNIELRDFLKEINRKLYIWKNEAKSLQVLSTKLIDETTNKSMS
jgi:hypothetical protein